MKTVWYDGLDEAQKKDLRADFISAHILRKRLRKLLDDKIDTKRTAIRKDTNYEKPNWDNYMADSLGYERALNEIMTLIEDEEK